MKQEDKTLLGQLGAILGKLERARRLPGQEEEFGVGKHHFRLNAPLSEAEIGAFEERHGVRLPNDYRLFLLLAGEGGAGPYYGIEPLSEWDYWFEEEAKSPGFLASAPPLPAPDHGRSGGRGSLPCSENRVRPAPHHRGDVQSEPVGGTTPGPDPTPGQGAPQAPRPEDSVAAPAPGKSQRR